MGADKKKDFFSYFCGLLEWILAMDEKQKQKKSIYITVIVLSVIAVVTYIATYFYFGPPR
ncbi:hypothetical protein ACQZV8_16540 [Magnetococcales bacterium HHB-1]